MSSFRFIVLLSACLAGVAFAQDEAEIARTRDTLAQRRSAADALYTSERAACYQRFAVNGCLQQVQRRHSDRLHDIRRDEIVLNNLERKRNAAAEMRKLEQRSSAETQEQNERDRRQRAQELADKQRDRDERLRGKNAPTPTSKQPNAKSTPTPRSQKSPQAQAHDAAQARQEFEQKQTDAAQHKADVEANRKARTKPLAAPLPPQGMAPTPLSSQLVAPLPAVPAAKPSAAP